MVAGGQCGDIGGVGRCRDIGEIVDLCGVMGEGVGRCGEIGVIGEAIRLGGVCISLGAVATLNPLVLILVESTSTEKMG